METITLSDDIVRELERLSARPGVSPEEIIRRGIRGYPGETSVQSQDEFESAGFGMVTYPSLTPSPLLISSLINLYAKVPVTDQQLLILLKLALSLFPDPHPNGRANVSNDGRHG